MDVRSPVEGVIDSLRVQRGDTVKKGQLLAKLEAGPERAALEGRHPHQVRRRALIQLDGKRDAAELIDALMDSLRRKELVPRRDGDDAVVSGDTEMRELLGPALEKGLRNLARRALLSAPA